MDMGIEESSLEKGKAKQEEDLAADDSTLSGGGGMSLSSSGSASTSAEDLHASKCKLIVDCLR